MLYSVLTWPPCAVIFFIAVCRLNAMPKEAAFRVVCEYSLWASIGFVVPFLPLIGEWPGVGMALTMYALAVILLCSAPAWAGDIAPDEVTDLGRLEIARATWKVRGLLQWERLKEWLGLALSRFKGER